MTRTPLENAADNTCFGCGPENPMGLRLRFFHEGDRVTTEASPTQWWAGQPGVVNPGILYAVMLDLVVWSASALVQRTPLLEGAPTHEIGGLSTKNAFTGAAWILKRDGARVLYRAELYAGDKPRAWMEQWTRNVTRSEYARVRPLVELPASLDGFFEPEG